MLQSLTFLSVFFEKITMLKNVSPGREIPQSQTNIPIPQSKRNGKFWSAAESLDRYPSKFLLRCN